MSFADTLRKSRSSPTTVLHEFLIHYDPNIERVHAFVEGTPDAAFYRVYLEQYTSSEAVRVYNCEGKGQVYETYKKVIERFSQCRRVVFFVDKDIDDITGESWPIDPRIYVTDVYSIENYLVRKEVVNRYLLDFVKLKKIEIDFDPMLAQFDNQLKTFYKAMLPIMGWIIASRRAGKRPVLGSININELLALSDLGVMRRKQSRRFQYLTKVTGVISLPQSWRQIRRTCRELQRLSPKRYVRGKFEAWFLLEFLKRLMTELSLLARDSGGSISVSAQVYEANFTQLLVRGLPVPQSLEAFLNFHLKSPKPDITEGRTAGTKWGWAKVLDWLRK
jgi:hypothetical protein